MAEYEKFLKPREVEEIARLDANAADIHDRKRQIIGRACQRMVREQRRIAGVRAINERLSAAE